LGQLGVAWVHLGYIKHIGICGASLACSKVDCWRLWLISHCSSPLFLRRSALDDWSSGSGGSGDIAGAGDVGDLILVVERQQLVGRRQGLGDVDGKVKHRDVRQAAGPALAIGAEVYEKFAKGDQ
jgi:hypothetical protein